MRTGRGHRQGCFQRQFATEYRQRKYNHPAIAQLLCQWGAAIGSALATARSQGHSECVRVLVAATAGAWEMEKEALEAEAAEAALAAKAAEAALAAKEAKAALAEVAKAARAAKVAKAAEAAEKALAAKAAEAALAAEVAKVALAAKAVAADAMMALLLEEESSAACEGRGASKDKTRKKANKKNSTQPQHRAGPCGAGCSAEAAS